MNSIFLGKIITTGYTLESQQRSNNGYFGRPYISQGLNKTIERVKIATIDIPVPLFKVGDEVYIDEIGKYTTIEKVTRSTSGSTIYNVTYIVKEIPLIEARKNNHYNLFTFNEANEMLKAEMIKYEEWKCSEESFDIFIKDLKLGKESYKCIQIFENCKIEKFIALINKIKSESVGVGKYSVEWTDKRKEWNGKEQEVLYKKTFDEKDDISIKDQVFSFFDSIKNEYPDAKIVMSAE